MFNNVLLERMCRLMPPLTPLSGSVNTVINQLTLLVQGRDTASTPTAEAWCLP